MQPLRIAITGAGPAGLAVALYLNRLGHQIRIFDQFEAPAPIGSGLMIQPTGAAVMRNLGLWERLERLGQRLERLEGRDAKSKRLVLDVSYSAMGLGAFGLGVHRAALFEVLFDAVVAAGLRIETGCEVAGSRMSGDGRALKFANGAEAGPFDLVVDCLGATSVLRGEARDVGRTRPLSFGALWATLDWVEGFDATALSQRYDRASVMIGVLPVGQRPGDGTRKAAFFWSCKHAEYPALVAEGLEAWKARVAGYWPETQGYLDQIEDFEQLTLARYRHATATVPFGDRLVLVGDSAHATSPQLGQGANMALLDARALYLAFSQADDPGDALERYVALRRWHVRFYQALSLALTPFYQSDSAVLAMVRDLVVAAPARLPPAQWLLAQMVAGTLGGPLGKLGLR